jgi:hypothetical protein
MATSTTPYQWSFFRAGGFDQVKIESGADLAHLDELDQKLWVALACPISGIDFDTRTASLIDTDKDGRIRAPELIAAAKWAVAMLKNPDLLIKGGDSVALDAINDATPEGKALLGSARHILSSLGQPDAKAISLAQAADGKTAFDNAAFNGDGIIVAETTSDPALRAIVAEIADCIGAIPDRSGKPGIDQQRADKFFDECAAFDAWMRLAETGAAQILPAGAETPAAAAAVKAITVKVDDYFSRCRVAAFDPRLAPMANRKDEEYAPILSHNLGAAAAELSDFPLARVVANQPLPLDGAVNPAHAAAVVALRDVAVRLLLGARSTLTESDWLSLQQKLAAFDAWQAAKVGASVEKLGLPRVRELLAGGARAKINALLLQDKALEDQAAAVGNVEKLVRYVRDLARLVRNFVNFKDLYGGEIHAVFQTGVLYLDRRACYLCLNVQDPAKHAAMAALSGAYLAYCDCVRRGSNETFSIVAIFSQGDDDNLMVGRNGIFYDRHGRDYDATITKIISSPISIREAFWAPYKKLSRVIEEHVAKKAAAADADVNTQLTAVATTVPVLPAAPAAPAAPATPTKPAFDPSVVALLSVAVGSLATAFAAGLGFFGKFPQWQLPLIVAGILILISLPSLILAYMKLRKRNLGPILDANGWAINAKASINVPFGARLTAVAHLPPNAHLDTYDAFEARSAKWPKFLLVAFIIWWIYAVLYDTGPLYLMTRDWETPIGNPPANLRPRQPTNGAPAVITVNTNSALVNTNAAAK